MRGCVGSTFHSCYCFIILLASQLQFMYTDVDETLIYSYKIAHIWIGPTPDVTSLLTHGGVDTNVECIVQCATETYNYPANT